MRKHQKLAAGKHWASTRKTYKVAIQEIGTIAC